MQQWSFNHICFEGVIGAGKTSLCQLLAERFNGKSVLEKVEENPFLSRFYKDRSAFAFQTQLWFLLARYKQLSEELLQQDLFHSVVFSDYMLAKDRIFAQINLDENELSLYSALAEVLDKKVPRPEVVIYLQASTDVLLQRIEKRGRPFEFNMDRGYIESLNEAYNHFFFHFTECPLLIINTNEIDFVSQTEDLDTIIDQIVRVKTGTQYFQPPAPIDKRKLHDLKKESPAK